MGEDVIPAPFNYVRPTSLEGALDRLANAPEGTKVLAGGHSLLPLMKHRFAAPDLLIDIGGLPELSYIKDEGSYLAIGAGTRHHDLATSALVTSEVGVIARAAGMIGDPQVRHRGTIGGSLAHADPAADLPAVLLALDASLVCRRKGEERVINVGDFFTGYFETALRPDELLVEVRVGKGLARFAYEKFTRRAQDWAIVGVTVTKSPVVRIALCHMAPIPVRAHASEAALQEGASPDEAAVLADEGLEPPSDFQASAEYRRHLARVLLRRALEAVVGESDVARV